MTAETNKLGFWMPQIGRLQIAKLLNYGKTSVMAEMVGSAFFACIHLPFIHVHALAQRKKSPSSWFEEHYD
jgi:hypothetical protein